MPASDLLSKLERAEGADRELARLLWEALTGECTHRNTHFVYLENDERELECSDCGRDTYGADKWSDLTRSLDAALALVERVLPGTEWAVSTLYGKCHAEVNMNAEEPATAQAATIPLALCIALLRAVKASEQTP